MRANQTTRDRRLETSVFNRHLEEAGWGLLLIMSGLLWLVPDQLVPQGTWLVGAGLILLVLNAVRYFSGVEIGGVSTVLGFVALILGLAGIAGLEVSLLPIVLVAIGFGLLLKPLFDMQR